MSRETDVELMHRIVARDRAAFAALVEAYMPDIHRFAYSILGDSARADDMTQDTFVRLWDKAHTWNPSGRVRSWLMRITHNLCIDHIRALRGAVTDEFTSLALPDQGPDPAQAYAGQALADAVNLALFSLPERQRTALMLMHYEGYSQREAADIMGVSVQALESLLSRGRRALRGLLDDTHRSFLEG